MKTATEWEKGAKGYFLGPFMEEIDNLYKEYKNFVDTKPYILNFTFLGHVESKVTYDEFFANERIVNLLKQIEAFQLQGREY